MDVTSLFLTEPLLIVRWGQRDLGSVDPSSLASRDEHSRPTILLGGRAWGVRDIDWDRRVVWVEPVDEPGRSRWAGAGAALSIEVCHAIRSVLAGDDRLAMHLTQRGSAKLAELQDEYSWATRVARLSSARPRVTGLAGGRSPALALTVPSRPSSMRPGLPRWRSTISGLA